MSDPTTSRTPRLKWHCGKGDDHTTVAGYFLHAWRLCMPTPEGYVDGGWAWTIFGNNGAPSGQPSAKGKESNEVAAQCAAEAAAVRLLSEDEGVAALQREVPA